MPAREPASLEVSDLSFRYPGAEAFALDAATFGVRPGERVGLLGPNGAGKSTLMRLVCGYLAVQHHRKRPAPKLSVAGLDVTARSQQVRGMVGYLPEQVPLYVELRVAEHLDFRAAIKRVPKRKRRREIDRVAEMTGLARMLDMPIQKLSRGYRQRVGIADALLGAPPLVVLDEPTVGLDPNQVQGVRGMLRDLGGEQTLIFSSHILAEVEALCDRIIILSRGKVVADETVADAMVAGALIVELRGEAGPVERLVRDAAAEVAASDRASAPDAAETRSPLVGLRVAVEDLGDGYCRAVVDGVDNRDANELPTRVGKRALDAGMVVRKLERGRRPLEVRFAEVTGATRPGERPGPGQEAST